MQKKTFTNAFVWITGRKKSHFLTPAQKHCLPLFRCHTILTSSRKTPPPHTHTHSVRPALVTSAAKAGSLCPHCLLFFAHCPRMDAGGKGVYSKGQSRCQHRRWIVPRGGRGEDSWYSLYTLETHTGRAGICFKEESTCPWLLNDALAL